MTEAPAPSPFIATVPAQDFFAHKQLSVTFYVVNQDGSKDNLTLAEGHRIHATISHAGINVGSELALTIEGMTPHDMNRLSFVENHINKDNPTVTDQSTSTLELRAGNDGQPLSLVFSGSIFASFASFNGGSSVFNVHARTTTLLSRSITPPLSYRGSVSVPKILSDICQSAGLSLVDHGGWQDCPNLTNHYVYGTAQDKINSVINAAGGTWDVTHFQHTSIAENSSPTGMLNVWGSAYARNILEGRSPASLPLINQESGLIGYPNYSAIGLSLDCLFRADISFYTPIYVASSRAPAGWTTDKDGKNQQGQYIGDALWNGYWLPLFVTHTLSSNVPNGPWMTHIECQRAMGR